MTWTRDPGLAPYAITALDEDWLRRTLVPGFNAAAAHYELTFTFDVRRFDTYLYAGGAPRVANGTAEQLIVDAITRLDEAWRDEWLPEARRLADDWPSDLAESVERARGMWELHFIVVFPQLVAMSAFDELCGELFGTDDPFLAATLAQGRTTSALEIAQELWEAARSGEPTSFLAAHGGRSDGLVSVSVPSWREDRALVDAALAALRDAPSPRETHEAIVHTRDRQLASARAMLAAYPSAVRDEFEASLDAAACATALHADHHIAIDEPVTYLARMQLLELGERIGVGADVFHLTVDELMNPSVHDVCALIAARKAELAAHAGFEPPAALEVDASPAERDAPPDPVAIALGKMFAPAESKSSPDRVVGNPGSPGTATGRVRVVRTLADAHMLLPGEVLVAETTSPPWTPFFERASAVVTDVGGMLSHSAVVAREYRVPAVVGTGDATALLHDGVLVEVDGAAGVVRVLM